MEMTMQLTLTKSERELLFRQNPMTEGDGGYQKLLVGLQKKLDPASSELLLSVQDLKRIPQYAFDYGNGGWEDRLVKIFGRSLGPKLGRT
jgi:hypothetical protein